MRKYIYLRVPLDAGISKQPAAAFVFAENEQGAIEAGRQMSELSGSSYGEFALPFPELTKPQVATSVLMIDEERTRQRMEEPWTVAAGSDEAANGELNKAAVCYALCALDQQRGAPASLTAKRLFFPWPYADALWEPSEIRVTNLIRAAAFLAAEIERLTAARSTPTSADA